MLSVFDPLDEHPLTLRVRDARRSAPAIKSPAPAGWRLEEHRPHSVTKLMKRRATTRAERLRGMYAALLAERKHELELLRARDLEQRTSDVAKVFRESYERWREDTKFVSSVTELILHPAYQRIIGLGHSALPMIFAELRNKPDHWFAALEAITGANPVSREDRGRMKRMTALWLEWAASHKIE